MPASRQETVITDVAHRSAHTLRVSRLMLNSTRSKRPEKLFRNPVRDASS